MPWFIREYAGSKKTGEWTLPGNLSEPEAIVYYNA
jgi:hypothetical protein